MVAPVDIFWMWALGGFGFVVGSIVALQFVVALYALGFLILNRVLRSPDRG